MKISVGIPVRNGERFLEHAILSAVRQTRSADEILVLDHGSTDGTAAIARSSRWTGRVRYVFSAEGSGFSDAFNQVGFLAEGDFVSILCADDLLDEDCLEALECGLHRFPLAGLGYGGWRQISEAGVAQGASPLPHSRVPESIPGPEYTKRFLEGVRDGAPIHRCAGFCVGRELMRERPFRREAGLIADTDFFVRIGQITDAVGISRPLASVRCHSTSVSSRLESMSLRLAEDYVFLVESAEGVAGAGDLSTLSMYQGLAARFLDQLFVEAIRRGRPEYLQRAFQLLERLEIAVPRYWQRHPRRIRERAWHAARSGLVAHTALRCLVGGTAVLRQMRYAVRGRAARTEEVERG